MKGGAARSQVLRQAWWARVAALLVVGQVIIAVIFIGDENAVAGIALALGGALLVGWASGNGPKRVFSATYFSWRVRCSP